MAIGHIIVDSSWERRVFIWLQADNAAFEFQWATSTELPKRLVDKVKKKTETRLTNSAKRSPLFTWIRGFALAMLEFYLAPMDMEIRSSDPDQ